MMYVPAGEFEMGTDDGTPAEAPAHQVSLSAYWIDKTEVTMAMYEACADAGQCKGRAASQPSDQSPVTKLAWDDANTYCSFAGARLPTEAEWEKAARGTDGRLYPWGMDPDKLKTVNYSGDGKLPPVGSIPEGASPYGVLDMAGSAFEWVSDWYSSSYYAISPANDPTGPTTGSNHVIRGGWFEWTKGYVNLVKTFTTYRSTYRAGDGFYGRQMSGSPIYTPGAGFRCAQAP